MVLGIYIYLDKAMWNKELTKCKTVIFLSQRDTEMKND